MYSIFGGWLGVKWRAHGQISSFQISTDIFIINKLHSQYTLHDPTTINYPYEEKNVYIEKYIELFNSFQTRELRASWPSSKCQTVHQNDKQQIN